MKTKLGVLLLTLVSSLAFAQVPPTGGSIGVGAGPGPMGPGKQMITFRRELGAWWKNSKVAEKLNLTDTQIKQLEDAFYQHRLKLVDIGADVEKSDMKLQMMLDADNVDESAVNAQVERVLAARGNMEREFTAMNLNFRKILTPDQWKQLRQFRGSELHDRLFIRHAPGPGGPGDGPMTAPAPGPGPQSELMPEDFQLPEAGADCTTQEANGLKIVQCTKHISVLNDLEHEL